MRAYEERSSLRGLRRTFGVSPTTVIGWIKKVTDLGEPKDTLMLSEGSVEDKVLELDELSLVLRLWQVRKSVDLAGPLAGLTPAAKGERRQPAPPSLVLEAHRPPRLVLGQADQSVAASFFRLY